MTNANIMAALLRFPGLRCPFDHLNRKPRARPGARRRRAQPRAFTRGCWAGDARGQDRAGRPIDEKRNGATGLGRNGQA
jgi:hypothetical protein